MKRHNKSIKKKLLSLFVVIFLTISAGTSQAYAMSVYDEIYTNLNLLASACRSAGYTNTATCLENAICAYNTGGSNGDLAYGSGTSFSNLLKSSSEYQTVKQAAMTIARANRSLSTISYSNSIALNSNTDLYLSLHNIEYSVTISKISTNNYSLNITWHDTYNFAEQDWENYGGTPSALFARYIVQYAYQAQVANIIDPYEIYLFTSDTFSL